MNALLEQVKSLAAQYHAKRLCLFGSRARGDCRPDSDYDFALWGIPSEKQPLFLDAADGLPSLLKMDFVFVSDETSPALLARIQEEGVVLLDRFETKYENFKQALERLREGLSKYERSPDTIVRDGIIQRFEFTCELAWKTAREYLLEQGHADLNSPKPVMRQALADGLISDGDGWIALLTDRNRTSHIYDEATAEQIFERIRTGYTELMQALLEQMQ